MARATGIGSMPGGDLGESFRVVLGELSDLPFVPELPGRGVHAGMTGRALGLVTELGADLQPDGWRVGVGEGVDQRRARSLVAQDLDLAEEVAHELDGPLKVQVAGPLTLAASVEHPRGEKVLADSGARRDLADALADGVQRHVADLRRRFSRAQLVVQVDEPSLRAVLDAQVPTASGYRRHRRIDQPEADDLLRRVVDVVVAGGATPVVHTCAADVPVALLQGVGFSAISFDLALARPVDAWAEAFESGVDLWVGTEPERAGVDRVVGFFGELGFEPGSFLDRLVLSAPCGVAGSTPDGARASFSATTELARRLDDRRPS